MASKQLKHMNELYASIKERYSKPDIDLATIRDIVENLHLAGAEPEAVTYAEVDADGVPALWCIPEGCDPDRVLLHSHAGGTVVCSMPSPSLSTDATCTFGVRRSRPPFRRDANECLMVTGETYAAKSAPAALAVAV
jgi:hypothetical protein